MSETLHPIVHDIPEAERADLVALLNARLADTADLYSQVKMAHWNVKGIHFQTLHELFDKVAEAVEPYVDELAERVTGLGGTARGSVRMAAAASSLDEYPADVVEGDAHLELVRDRLATYAADNRRAIDTAGDLGDAATEDLLTEIQRVVDLHLYFVQSHLPG
ncbi:MAG: DNA starvation/stationary phase protection protein Dps [Trueperaceae bacterium]